MLPEYVENISDIELMLYKVRGVLVLVGKRDKLKKDNQRDEDVILLDLKHRVLRADDDIEAGYSMGTPADALQYMRYLIEESSSEESFQDKSRYISSSHALWGVLTKDERDELLESFRDEQSLFPGDIPI